MHNQLRKVGAIAGIAGAALTIEGCSNTPEPTVTKTVTVTAEAPATTRSEAHPASGKALADLALAETVKFQKDHKMDKGRFIKNLGNLQAGTGLDSLAANQRISDNSFILIETKPAKNNGFKTLIDNDSLFACLNDNSQVVESEKGIKKYCPNMPDSKDVQISIATPNKPDLTSISDFVDSVKDKGEIVDYHYVQEDQSSKIQGVWTAADISSRQAVFAINHEVNYTK